MSGAVSAGALDPPGDLRCSAGPGRVTMNCGGACPQRGSQAVRDCELFIFSGYVDASRVEEYREAVEVFWESSASHAVVDLADLAFFGSEGLEFVLCLARIARGRAGTVTLIDADDAAVLEIEHAGWSDVVRHARWSAPERQPDPQPVRASIPGQRSPEASTAADAWLGRQSFAVPV